MCRLPGYYGHTLRALLSHMHQFMCEKPFAGIALRRVLSSVECDVISIRVGKRVHGAGRFRRANIRMYPHAAEIISEPRLEKRACCRVEGLAG